MPMTAQQPTRNMNKVSQRRSKGEAKVGSPMSNVRIKLMDHQQPNELFIENMSVLDDSKYTHENSPYKPPEVATGH